MEMMRTFNNGLGLIMIVPDESAQEVMERLNAMDEKAFVIGRVIERDASKPRVNWVRKGD